MPTTRALGPLTVTALQDAQGPFFEPRESAITATAAQWAAADALDPAALGPDRTTRAALLRSGLVLASSHHGEPFVPAA